MFFVMSPERKREYHEKSKSEEINYHSPYGSHCRCRKFVFLSGLWIQMCTDPEHLVNILCVVTVGPWWALAQAFIASLIRNLIGLGSPLAFPGSMCGALLGGLLYKYGKKLPFAYIGEVVGTGILGGMLSYPIAYLVMGNKAAALFTFVVPFLISTCGGTLIAIVITASLKKTGVLGRMQASLEE